MIDLKPYGAFVENTIRPLLGELKQLDIKITDDNISKLVKYSAIHHMAYLTIQSLTTIIVASIICYTVQRLH